MVTGYDAKYGATRFVGAVIAFVGWLVIIASLAGLMGAGALADDARQDAQKMVAAGVAGFSLLFTLMGLLLAGAGQLIRAMADNTNNTGAMLALMKAGTKLT